MAPRTPAGTIRNTGAYSRTERVYTKRVNGYLVATRPPKKENRARNIALELIDDVVLSGVVEMAVAGKVALRLKNIKNLTAIKNDVKTIGRAITSKAIGKSGGKLSKYLPKKIPKIKTIIAVGETAYKISDTVKTVQDAVHRAERKPNLEG